jgi:hypothetical protein
MVWVITLQIPAADRRDLSAELGGEVQGSEHVELLILE